MAYLLGLDLGTSSAKAMVADEYGNCISGASKEYGVESPADGYAEQSGETLWSALTDCIQQALHGANICGTQISGVGLSGQMHGLALIDQNKALLRPIIIWLDKRSNRQVAALEKMAAASASGNRFSTGFFLPSLLWVRETEPEVYARARYALLPKDYIRLKLCGEVGTDVSDASGTLLFDQERDSWDIALAEKLGIDTSILPQCHFAWETAGQITPQAAAATGLAAGTPVVYGGSDSSMQLVGSGCVKVGNVNTNIGTGSQFAVICSKPLIDGRLNAFRHSVPEKWSNMVASLNGGCVLKWLRDGLFPGVGSYKQMDALAESIPSGSGGVVFLPYINGERSPDLDSNARGIFFGLRPEHGQAHFIRAAMESVIFTFRRGRDIFSSENLPLDQTIVASGGGANSAFWLQMQADILQSQIVTNKNKEEACLGAAIMAGIGCGIYANAEQGSEAAVQRSPVVYVPNSGAVHALDQSYQVFCALYEKNRELFALG